MHVLFLLLNLQHTFDLFIITMAGCLDIWTSMFIRGDEKISATYILPHLSREETKICTFCINSDDISDIKSILLVCS